MRYSRSLCLEILLVYFKVCNTVIGSRYCFKARPEYRAEHGNLSRRWVGRGEKSLENDFVVDRRMVRRMDGRTSLTKSVRDLSPRLESRVRDLILTNKQSDKDKFFQSVETCCSDYKNFFFFFQSIFLNE